MASYIDCFVGSDGLIYIGFARKKGLIGYFKSLFHPPLKPRIILTEEEARALKIDYHKSEKGFYIESSDGIRIPLDII